MEKRVRHPLNAEGDFFVEYDMCMQCDAPQSVASELMDYDKNGHCYFKRQPQTPEEVEHAINAVYVSCCEGVIYEGNDPDILRKTQADYYSSKIEAVPSYWQSFFDKLFKLFR